MTTRRTATRLPMLIATIAMIVGLMPAAPAAAHGPGAAEGVRGTAHLPIFPCPGICAGTFSGLTALLVIGTDIGTEVPTSAAFVYTDDCVTGTASGTIAFSSPSESLQFSWTRVGDKAVLIFGGPGHTGAGAATFVPDTGATACVLGGSAPVEATVAGAGVWL